jgi:hypothetical protein
MKKLVLASMLASVGLFAQSSTTPAAPAKSNPAPAQGQSQTAKPKVHRHKKGTSSVAPAAKGSTPAAPTTPSK